MFLFLFLQGGKGSPCFGLTPLQYAEQLNARKMVNEIKEIQAWEDSLDTLMKAVRSEDVERVETLCKRMGESAHYRDANNGKYVDSNKDSIV